ncbi:MAG TPA: UDP-N-acetylmuramoyl-L-alanine--D-glutamate ligase [Thermoanaerobaculia bacterium]|jgi:UDP-N-acetylmuramoylalanine--D-glutamate ligase|nr:UDP-N-acetylmuramoyl-L-alanine--D-glutamate ligase [Thermoanaerobaculia bacterium]
MNGPWGHLRRVLVYGLGLSGRAAARLLIERGAAVLAVDDKAVEVNGDLGGKVELLPGGGSQALPPDVDAVVVSPGVPLDRPVLEEARRRKVPVIAEVELAFPFLDGPVVAITGSNGKSTTTAMAGEMVRAAGLPVEVCGNIGEPLADKVDGPAGRVFVVELSSFQIEGIATFKPKAAALLNLSEDHLDRYGTLAAYGAAKKRLFRDMDPDGVAVLNADDPETVEVETRARRRFFSRLRPVSDGCWADTDGRVVEVSPGEPASAGIELFNASDVPLAGVQNLENAMAAALLARAVGVEPEAIRAALHGFRGLPHRLQKVGEKGGVFFYDDSKGTNPGATLKAIEGFADGTVHLILGGRNKDADLSVLTPMVRRKARRAYLIGEAAAEFEQALGEAVPFEKSGTMEKAVQSAAAQARSGEAVVLSPACASFDQFKNFVHRGQVFQELVKNELTRNTGGGPNGEEARV